MFTSAAAPILLVGGWMFAEVLQPPGFDPVRDTISQLAALDATDRAVMTTALIGTGAAYLATAYAFGGVRRLGRLLIAIGGVGTILVAAFPLPAYPLAHALSAGVAFLALAAWPLFAADRGEGAARALRPPLTVVAGIVLLALVAWFAVAQQADVLVGLAERVAAAAQATWPFIVALSLRNVSSRLADQRTAASS
ncbi:DUF998 domain-containing protein [Catellatospora citrea]|uniref:DUF998 domain-containing protein n=1 Tax=Catellatospora citrea TaxID=53366 RepID=UPI001476F10A|nr:DUF998 domain-containing protein [Catellatospora citrea]